MASPLDKDTCRRCSRPFDVCTCPAPTNLLEMANRGMTLEPPRSPPASPPPPPVAPIPMRLPCEKCGKLHIDEGEFATKPHHTHTCQHCGLTWRPAIVPTVGVRFLPGFKNETPPADADAAPLSVDELISLKMADPANHAPFCPSVMHDGECRCGARGRVVDEIGRERNDR